MSVVTRAVAAERENVLAICRTLTDIEWQTASDCTGWRVQDVIAHLGSLAHAFVRPGQLRPATTAERINDRMVDVRRGWSPDAVLAEYEQWSAPQLTMLTHLQRPVVRSVPVPLPGLGVYRAHLLANATLFDLYLHLRHDIGAALPRLVVEPAPAATMAAILEWVLGGVPQMCKADLDWLDVSVELALTGPGGTLRMVGPDTRPAARITATAADFVVWSTRRRPWRDYDVTITGNTDIGQRLCDSLNVI